MTFTDCPIAGAYHVEAEPHEDERGLFARAWCREAFEEHGMTAAFAQANLSYNHHAGTIRGLHYQAAPHTEAKYIRAVRGAIYDVIVDLRRGSPSHLRWHAEKLTADRRNALYVPEGCAHGYQTLTDEAEVFYLVTAAYAPEFERGIRYDDPQLAIDWPLEATTLSDKDRALPTVSAASPTQALAPSDA